MKDGYFFSGELSEKVYICKIKREGKRVFDGCDCCGKPLKSVIYSVTGEDGGEALYGSECVKKLRLEPCTE